MERFLTSALVSLALLAPLSAHADDARVTIALTPSGEHSPWVYELSVTSLEAQEVAFDRRLLRLEVRAEGSRRRLKCVHPDAPRRRPQSRVMAAGETHTEWIDLRMYCWGRALRALRGGSAQITSRFGFRRRGRGRFVARREGERRPLRDVEGPSFDWTGPRADAEPGPLRIGLADHSSRGSVRFRPSIRAGSATNARVYLRDDQYSFEVDGPRGHVTCAHPRLAIVPIRDRFRRLRRRRIREFLDADYYCPEGTFDEPGVYVVTPVLTLPHSGESLGIEALTGVFVGSPGVIRVRTRRYDVHEPSELRGEGEEP